MYICLLWYSTGIIKKINLGKGMGQQLAWQYADVVSFV